MVNWVIIGRIMAIAVCLSALYQTAEFTGAAALAGETEPLVFKVILQEEDREIIGILKMHFKKDFEGEWENGLFTVGFEKIKEITPIEPETGMVSMKLVSDEVVKVKILNALYLDKTEFGKFDIHLAKIKKIIRSE